MTSSMWRGARRSLGLLASAMVLGIAPAAAQERWQQSAPGYGAQQQTPPPAPDSAAELRRSLATVGTDPNNIAALILSGRSALAMGDAQAALTFFSRADEVAPRDARIKAGMASAMTLLGQPRAALTLFAEAQSLGAPEAEIASDRGLAHDLLGDPRAAQRDYALVLRRRDNDETRRRLALSLAISGQREPALRLLEPQIRRNDRAGWRTQAFVLALTGDAAGAARVASGTGPAGAAQAMTPFLARLPALSPAQRAMAVHLGVFPSDGRTQYAANIDTTPDPGALAFAGGPARPPTPPVATETAGRDERSALRRRQRASSPVERAAVAAPRRQQSATAEPPRASLRPYLVPGPSGELRVRTRVPRTEPARSETAPPARAAPEPSRFAPPVEEPAAPPVREAEPSAEPAPPPVRETEPPPPPPPASEAPPPAQVDAAILAGVRPGDMIAAPGFSLAPQPGIPIPAPSERRNSALSDIATLVNALPQDQQAGLLAPRETVSAPTTPPSPPPVARRHWVQVAGNVQRAGMTSEFRRLRGRAPALLDGMQAWTAGGSGRLLVGPFGSARDAQAFVNQLRPRGIEAVPWSSEAGQIVDQLAVSAGPARAAPERRAAAAGSRERSEPQRSTSASRGTRGRSEHTRAAPASRGRGSRAEAPSSRSARDRAETASSRGGRARGDAARSGGSRRPEARVETGRTGANVRGSRAAETRSNRSASTVERRANGNDARPSRRRPTPEPRPTPRGRRSN